MAEAGAPHLSWSPLYGRPCESPEYVLSDRELALYFLLLQCVAQIVSAGEHRR